MDRKIIIETILNVAKENNIKLDFNNLNVGLKEIGIDSLSMMNLIFKIESKIGTQLDDHVLVKIKTLGELINAFETQINK